MDASDALSTLNMVYGVVKKVVSCYMHALTVSHSFTAWQVKENQTELLHLSNRIKHAILSLEDLKRRNVIRDTVYTDAMSGIFQFVLFTVWESLVTWTQHDSTYGRPCAAFIKALFDWPDMEQGRNHFGNQQNQWRLEEFSECIHGK